MSDKELLLLIKTNPEKGYRKMLEQYQQAIYFFIRRSIFSHQDADDISQNVWIKVFKHIQNFRGDAKLSTWLYKIATNETYTFLQLEARKKSISLDALAESKAEMLSYDSLFTGDEIEAKLYKSVAQLPTMQRKVFQLKYFEELKYEEISEILDTSVGSLKASYHHAVQKIKSQMETELL